MPFQPRRPHIPFIDTAMRTWNSDISVLLPHYSHLFPHPEKIKLYMKWFYDCECWLQLNNSLHSASLIFARTLLCSLTWSAWNFPSASTLLFHCLLLHMEFVVIFWQASVYMSVGTCSCKYYEQTTKFTFIMNHVSIKTYCWIEYLLPRVAEFWS